MEQFCKLLKHRDIIFGCQMFAFDTEHARKLLSRQKDSQGSRW